ncbi:related to 4-coumarate-CoA ligase [Cephalotrichum gorgonifer]|uniref:Related to 4-coumarate-CoA ligase n=1 Tax=Cephalotrichum gorgonifer TaxID=2041049 RepID=A0AAE8MYT9_9PEZI|nr:related to 4-coumarate-CoA ligase [Cephalotrichum gorgonifer]
MSTIVEKRPEGTIYKSPTRVRIPEVDVLTFLFDSPEPDTKDDDVVHADAETPSRSITKSRQRTLLRQVAHTFREGYGIGADGPEKDVVTLLALGHYTVPTIMYATVAAGGIFSALSPASTPGEVASQLNIMESKLLVCTPQLNPVAVAAAKIAGLSPDRVLVLGDGDGIVLNEAASAKAVHVSDQELDWTRIRDKQQLESSVICVLFSSGTTGMPKGVNLSHTSLVAAAVLSNHYTRTHWRRVDPARAKKHCTLAHLPVAHVAGVQGYFVSPTYIGSTVYWMQRFDFTKFLQLNKKLQITSFFSVPPIYLLIAKSDAVTDQFASLDHAISGAAPLGKETQAEAMRKLGKDESVVLAQTWGLSETAGCFTLLPRGVRDDTGSIGPLIPECEARIVDEEGHDVEPGQPGEMWVRGPVVFKSYYKNDKATKECFVDGWLVTGDILEFRDGLFHCVDRKKELIKYKATQVAPAELEALLLSNAKILDAAVIGVQGQGTELPRAYVVADQGKISGQEIVDWVASKVSDHKRLRGGVVFIEAIPKSPSGKILRKLLRDAVQREDKAKI